MSLLGERAIVAGAGIGGLIAAGVLSEFFHEVLLLEKDALPLTPGQRKGVPQDGQIHVILKGGDNAFAAVFPGFRECLAGAGATPLEFGKDLQTYEGGRRHSPKSTGIVVHSQTRPLLEFTVRTLLAKLPNVRILDQTRLMDILRAPDGPVTGVAITDKDGQRRDLAADLVVECMGRSGYTGRWLAKNRGRMVAETELGIDLVYTSALLHRTAAWRGRNFGWITRPTAPHNTKSGVLVPIEGERWMMTLSGRFGEVPPEDEAGFLAYAKALEDPHVHREAKDARFATPITSYRIPRMIWRHYDQVADFPDRLIPLGDTIAGFNPLAAQGMSMAALHAITLRDALHGGLGGLGGAQGRYMTQAMKIAADVWSLGEMLDFAYPQAKGTRPDDLAERLAARAAVFKLAAHDKEVRGLVFEVQNMLRPPSALQDAALLARAFAV